MLSRRRRAEHLTGPVLLVGPDPARRLSVADGIADALGIPLYRVDISTVVSKYIGETEKNLDRIFARAAASGAVLLLDEADALLGRRTSVRDSHDRYANQGVSYLLERIETHEGMVVLATNGKEDVDPMIVRRFRRVIQVAGD